ncbi:4-hydroxyphenylacetate 3-monooxygenase, oxygenase component [Paenibacillus sediminis]|uniref:4-hydroxyphenylacetate 3-monooxygenase n=1 Tax=Paenibacillus sediminis TaxID=664909 RepID=A0ABS4H018_9BACL|nr:4-hydroxyphenylacetate 3-monooxygenase [Paenibacillus sediminis]
MPFKTGEQYRERLDRLQHNVWFRGEPVTGNITEHLAFRGLVSFQASLYDMQNDKAYQEKLTFTSEATGDLVGLSFLQPKTKKDLAKRREMMRLWADYHHGFLGRSPDYMNTSIMAFYSASDLLSELDPQYSDNLKKYFEYCREHDITLSHAFIQPQASRYVNINDGVEENLAAKVVDQNKDGIVVTGAFLMATQGVTAEEIFVFPPVSTLLPETDSPYTFVFAVPNNLPGLKFICRESLVQGDSAFDFPLSSKYEEMDTLVIFDQVLVPWDRVFLYGHEDLAHRFVIESGFHAHVSHQLLCKNIAKTEFLLGTIEYMVETSGMSNYPHVREKIAEIIVGLETLKSMLIAAEMNAKIDKFGSMVPSKNTILAANVLYPELYPRIIEIIQLLGGSSLVMIPSEKDFESDIAPYLNKYLKGMQSDAKEKVKLFRLAWEISAGSFGGRETLYERFFFGNKSSITSRLYEGYMGREKYIQKVKHFLQG